MANVRVSTGNLVIKWLGIPLLVTLRDSLQGLTELLKRIFRKQPYSIVQGLLSPLWGQYIILKSSGTSLKGKEQVTNAVCTWYLVAGLMLRSNDWFKFWHGPNKQTPNKIRYPFSGISQTAGSVVALCVSFSLPLLSPCVHSRIRSGLPPGVFQTDALEKDC